MLDVLPSDIIYHITLYLNLHDIHKLVIIKNVYDTPYITSFNNNRIIHCNRIKLFLRICYHSSLLFQELKTILNKHYYTMLSKHQSSFPLFNNQCLLYGPITPHDYCRFCSLNEYQHKYQKMIQIFLELVYK